MVECAISNIIIIAAIIGRKTLFGIKNKIDLRKFIDTAEAIHDEVKCRITYSEEIIKVEYEPYTIRPIHSLAHIEIGDLNYTHKYSDRKKLAEFFDKRGNKDDILMTKKGYITDTYYANVGLLKNGKWYTPKHPLLEGTMRAKLIKEGTLIQSEIHIDQINEFEVISIFNAMIPFQKIMITIKH